MIFNLLMAFVGLVLLAPASDQFVVGAARIAAALKMSPVLIGAVVIGFGTSAPELLASVLAAADGSLDLAVGNIVGSNLANVTLVLGLAAVFCKLHLLPGVLRRELPLSVAAVIVFAVLLQGGLNRVEGIALVIAMVAALVWLIAGKQETADAEEFVHEVEHIEQGHGHIAVAPDRVSIKRDVLRVLAGLIVLVAGAQLLVRGATGFAADVGLSGGFVGLTLVAVGTSLPEIVTAIAAARRKETELIVGNILGSNIFNSLAVGGAAALVGPGLLLDSGLTIVATAAMVISFLVAAALLISRRSLSRGEGLVLIAFYFVAMPFTL